MSTRRVAVITGSAQGIGKAIALRLAHDGYNVVVSDLASKQSEMDSLVQLVNQNAEETGQASMKPCDVTREEDVKQLVDFTVEHFGRIDVMVANAGIGGINDIGSIPAEEFNRIMQVNTQGALFAFRNAASAMIAGGTAENGRLLATGSLAGKMASPFAGSYCASKFALRGLVQVAAKEYGSFGITVNAFAPGLIETDLLVEGIKEFEQKAGISEEAYKSMALQSMAIKRLGKPEDVAHLASFLASEECSFITGQTISIDGGYHMD